MALRVQTKSIAVAVVIVVSSLGVAAAISTAVSAPATAINDYNAGGTRWIQPQGNDFKYWFDPASSAPFPNSEYKADVLWAAELWDDHPDGFGIDVIAGSSSSHNVRVIWKEISGSALGSVGAGGSPLQCTYTNPCTMTFDNDPDGTPIWETSTASVQSNEFQFRKVATHEVGHVLGFGHSDRSLRYNGEVASNTYEVAMGPALKGPSGAIAELTKDDCASASFQYRGDAVCNRAITRTWGSGTAYGIDADADDPEYFHGWGFGSAWEYVSCVSSSVGVSPNSCHWRMRPYTGLPTGAFGVIYDVEGAGDADGGTTQGMRSGSTWRAQIHVGAPSYNPGTVEFKLCMFMRDDASASQTALWKAGQVCTPWTGLAPGQDWTWKSTGNYTLPDHGRDDQYLRSYVEMKENGNSLYISQWEVERVSTP